MTLLRKRSPGPDRPASRKRRARARLAVFGVTLGALLVAINLASAVNIGGFEIDAGNATQNHALYSGTDSPPGDDWAQGPSQDGIFASAGTGNCYGSEIHSVIQPSTVICDGNSDTKFKNIQPEQNIVSPSGKTPDDIWPVKPGNVRPKNDFSHAYVNAETLDSPCDSDPDEDDLILRLGGHVGDNEGSHFWGFEFDRTAPGGFNLLKANGGAQFNLDFNRQLGDLLISFTVPGNANDPVSVDVYQVTGFQADGDAIFTLATAVAGCTDPNQPQGLTRLATNQSNDVEAPPWNVPVCDPTADNASNTCRTANGTNDPEDLLAPRDFAEASVDLTAFGITNPCFTNVIFTSRSSHVLEGADIQDVGGGDFPLCGTKSGIKFHDHNANGVKEAGDEVLEGWRMNLYSDDDGDGTLDLSEATPDQFDVTDANGAYSFSNLQNGDYIVCEVLQATWHQSLPNSGSSELADCTSQSGDATLGPNGYAFEMTGTDQPGNDFGNFHNATKSGTKFEDLDGDGAARETGEPGVANVTIHLFGTSGLGNAVHLHTTTDANGDYSIVAPPGTYTVCETVPTGYTQSFPTSGADCSAHGGGVGYSITLASGDTDSGNDFGNFRNGTKSGTKFNDLNANGVRDASEPGLSGVQIHLFGTDGRGNAVHLHQTTDANGDYSFSAPPGSYTACETAPTGYTQSYPTASTPNTTACASPHSGRGWVVVLTSNSTDSGNDFGNFQNATVSGMKFKDADADGIKDAGEGGLGGWIIHLFGTSGQGATVHTTTTTAANGTYSFTVVPGSYTVCEQTAPGKAGWTQSFPSSGADCTGHTDGGTITSGPFGHAVTATSGGTYGDKDFGNKPASKIQVTFLPQALLPDNTNATRATEITCRDAGDNIVGQALNANTLTTNNVFTNQSIVTCKITFVDP